MPRPLAVRCVRPRPPPLWSRTFQSALALRGAECGRFLVLLLIARSLPRETGQKLTTNTTPFSIQEVIEQPNGEWCVKG